MQVLSKQGGPCSLRSRRDSRVLCSVNERQEVRRQSSQGTSTSGMEHHKQVPQRSGEDCTPPNSLLAQLAKA